MQMVLHLKGEIFFSKNSNAVFSWDCDALYETTSNKTEIEYYFGVDKTAAATPVPWMD